MGEWTSESAGGARTDHNGCENANWALNPQYLIRTSGQGSHLKVVLWQHDPVSKDKIGMVLVKSEDTGRKYKLSAADNYLESIYHSDKCASIYEYTSGGNNQFIVVPSKK